ncbi:MAG: hypothetical protein COT34_02120 [Candidatus Nealsonbacteria bacterium CG08_land_8_20_14_0_20_43_11]|uniref:Uncharacterized protein n=1 Tax=Candidatus Nealsonbacteria bacterium CG08_land_8_20_14_0_20_43_11 TaxID=1974706 RepID=A0A2M6T0Z1_9BACT|nr:MAG: hypothetical protein COT34_02120 [Candidatus Nealsonbacteria bacterium CG08_land_8_20_14_0_20_43_11]
MVTEFLNRKVPSVVAVILILFAAVPGVFVATSRLADFPTTVPIILISGREEMAENGDSKEAIKINFVKIGNLVKHGDNWVLVYEEAEQPVLTAPLSFSRQSLCVREEKTTSCGEFVLDIGERVKIEGEEKQGQVLVVELTVVK